MMTDKNSFRFFRRLFRLSKHKLFLIFLVSLAFSLLLISFVSASNESKNNFVNASDFTDKTNIEKNKLNDKTNESSDDFFNETIFDENQSDETKFDLESEPEITDIIISFDLNESEINSNLSIKNGSLDSSQNKIIETKIIETSAIEHRSFVDICKDDLPKITPYDAFFWNAKIALEQVNYFFTFNSSKKAKLSLALAKERLCELQKLIEQRKIESAKLAEQKYSNLVDEFEKNIEKVSEENDVYGLNELFLEQKQFILGIDADIKSTDVVYSFEEKKAIESFVNLFLATEEKVKVVVDFKIKKFEIKNKAKEEKAGDEENELNASSIKLEK